MTGASKTQQEMRNPHFGTQITVDSSRQPKRPFFFTPWVSEKLQWRPNSKAKRTANFNNKENHKTSADIHRTEFYYLNTTSLPCVGASKILNSQILSQRLWTRKGERPDIHGGKQRSKKPSFFSPLTFQILLNKNAKMRNALGYLGFCMPFPFLHKNLESAF